MCELNALWDGIGKSKVHVYVDSIFFISKIFLKMGLSVMMQMVVALAPNFTMVMTMETEYVKQGVG